jgi:hypothetical protein
VSAPTTQRRFVVVTRLTSGARLTAGVHATLEAANAARDALAREGALETEIRLLDDAPPTTRRRVPATPDKVSVVALLAEGWRVVSVWRSAVDAQRSREEWESRARRVKLVPSRRPPRPVRLEPRNDP